MPLAGLTPAVLLNLDIIILFLLETFWKYQKVFEQRSYKMFHLMENIKQKNHVIYVFICRYESNPKKSDWNSSEKLMSLVTYLLSNSAAAFVDIFRNIDRIISSNW